MKRFYRDASLGRDEHGFRVLLDGRAVKTQGGRPQALPTSALGDALVAEWADQGEEIDTTRFAFRDMADHALDIVAADPAEAIAGLLPYADTDTLCYRAEPDEALGERQTIVWEPIVATSEERFGVRFSRVAGVIHFPHPPETLQTLRAHLETLDPFTLAALVNLTSLAASLIVGLAAIEDGADLDALWDAASLEEDWQAELWGKDAEAQARRDRRRAAFLAAARFAALARTTETA
ncbi:ATP12 ATPase [Novosphingobium nitrogenifigens DSM 19370]|uniref:ATP12 ATPase n=1 Tax=Novosphingobium nitrogenifigens DSM 19370 TaxID=983920 RepID=F1ZBM5_9SPHN|nr:ATP12 family protein [Novosphingobium nitrogenifigens]EGD57891.1 ATP12 ATPase [Novosphingobium nitrogenifigens DSM 19370]